MVAEEVRSDQILCVWRAARLGVMNRLCPKGHSAERWRCEEQTRRVEPSGKLRTVQVGGGKTQISGGETQLSLFVRWQVHLTITTEPRSA